MLKSIMDLHHHRILSNLIYCYLILLPTWLRLSKHPMKINGYHYSYILKMLILASILDLLNIFLLPDSISHMLSLMFSILLSYHILMAPPVLSLSFVLLPNKIVIFYSFDLPIISIFII